MGTDIHAAIEYRKNAKSPWVAVMRPNPYAGKWDGEEESTARLELDRDYDMFSILGNVRNGYGFAGCKTGSGFIPMSDNRGVPEDISADARKALSDEHSPTWVTLGEILSYDWARTTTHSGYINARQFEKWDKDRMPPDSWSGDISGGGIQKVSNLQMRRAVKSGESTDKWYTQVEWAESYKEAGSQIFEKILPEMQKYAHYGLDNVRLVMDFDS